MKNEDDSIARNIEKIKKEGKRNVFFGISYIQSLCHIGYNQAARTIECCLEEGILEMNPNLAWEYSIAI